eukprot:3523602-Rhodomonas_salina.4
MPHSSPQTRPESMSGARDAGSIAAQAIAAQHTRDRAPLSAHATSAPHKTSHTHSHTHHKSTRSVTI